MWWCSCRRTTRPTIFPRCGREAPASPLTGRPSRSDQLVADAASLARLSMVWHDSPYDEHPVADVTMGQDKVWQAVDAVVAAGHWADTVLLLTWDDWGGWDDQVATPNVEHTPDGVQLAYRPRVPLLMFGGPVRPGIDSRWSSHPSIGRTVLDLFGLPPLGVARLDHGTHLHPRAGRPRPGRRDRQGPPGRAAGHRRPGPTRLRRSPARRRSHHRRDRRQDRDPRTSLYRHLPPRPPEPVTAGELPAAVS